ncbi:MAG TPA: type II secretion system protein GspL [Casimicrobiaceae bacterium]|nr:type II secretion system protein GspL [Casimicrobiaceae bacterium]
MSVLRVLLSAPMSPTRAEPWALFDDAGRVVDRGRSTSDRWPSAPRREAVLAASLVRVVGLRLPPMSASRVAAAAAYALEDRLAATDDAPAIGVSSPRPDGSVVACVVARAMLDAVTGVRPRFERILAEPALAPAAPGWTWYASGAGGGFVRSADGSAFAVGNGPADDTLPPELVAALTQSARKGEAPREVSVAERCAPDMLAAWRGATGVPFVAGAPWRWDDASPTTFAAAPDLAGRAETPSANPRDRWRVFRPALAIAAAALALHVVATIAQWSWLKYDAWRTGRAIVALAQSAGLTDATTPEAALRGLARRDAELRHRAGQSAPSDALPMLARAAPAFATLPSAAVKSATYADDAWTFELAALDAPAQAALERRLRDAALAPLQAKTSAGYRMRVAAAP